MHLIPVSIAVLLACV